MKVLRYTLVAATVFVAAACGDKVNVQGVGTTDTTQRVNSVSVSPSNVTMNINQTVTFSAIVDVSNGAAQTVTWSPTSGAVSVSSAGVATANSATAGVAVCATSTVDATKKGCAQAVVNAGTTVIPATVSIQSITVGCPVAAGTCGLNTPINPLAVTGNIDVLVNVSPGNETVSKVEVIVTSAAGVSTVAGTQTFTASQSAALRFAADEAMANQSAFPPILFSINTAAFAAATGIPTWLNGNYVISVKLYVTGTTAARATATFTTTLAFVNANTYVLTTSFTGTTGTANSAAGFSYRRGSISISALPVIYTSGISMAAGTVSFGNPAATLCDRGSAFGTRAVALTAPAAGSSAWTGTLVYTPGSGAAAGDIDVYEYDPTLATCPAATLAVGEGFTLTATDNAGNAFLSAAAAANAAANLYRVDNRPPVVPLAVKNPNGRQSGWINASVVLNGVNALTATSNGWMVNGAAVGCATTDCGVGGYNRQVRMAAAPTGLVTEARLVAASTTLPAPSITNTTYCAVISATDALGNESALPATATACGAILVPAFLDIGGGNPVPVGQSQLFGVDIAAPTIAYTAASMPANSRRSAATIAGEFIVVVNDTGIVGNSGMLLVPPAVSPVGMRVEARRAGTVPNSAGATVCNDASGPTIPTVILCTALATSGQAPLGAGTFSTTMTGTTGGPNHAYYTHFATGTDAAGNSASIVPRVVVYDAAPPLAGTPSAPVTITATNFSASAFISEDLDIQDYSFGANYGAVAPFSPAAAILQMANVAVNGFNAAIFSNTNFGVTTTVPLPLALQQNVACACLTNATFQANGLLLQARAQSNLPGVSAANFIPGAVTPGTAIALTNWTTFPAVTLPAAVTGTVTGNTTAATAAQPANVLLTATITGTTAIFNNPFSRMDFYMLDAPGARYYLVGTAGVASLNDNGATRTFTFTATINGATVYSLLNGAGATWVSNVVAVGIGAANGNIGMVAAANTALSVVF